MGEQSVRVKFGDASYTVMVNYVSDDTAADQELILPEGTLEIQAEAFQGAAAQTVRCPEGLTSIGARAFADCVELERVFIPDSVVDIDETAFDDCGDLWIFAPKGSTAEEYAERHTIKFFAIG